MTVVDENEDALSRLGENWPGAFLVGHGMDAGSPPRGRDRGGRRGRRRTDGDNTNIVISQVAQKRFGIECVVARILDPARADFYAARGLRTVCPTKTAIDVLGEAVRACAVPQVPA